MPKQKLTELSVARLKPPVAGRLEVWDTLLPAFGVRITSAGRRSWIVAVRKPGTDHPSRIKLGEPPTMSLADARTKARELMTDPDALERRERAKADTVGSIIGEFVERYAKPRNRTWQETERTLRHELAPWARRPLTKIRRADVLRILDHASDRASRVRANRIFAALRKFFGWCVERGLIEASPAAGVKPPGREVSRDRVLDDDELTAVWRACNGLSWPFGPLIRLLVVTGARRDEAASMRWEDLDLDRRLWTIPREMTKTDRAHEVPLSDLALEIIKGLPRIGTGPLVFPANRRSSSNPVSGFSRVKLRLDELSGVEGWRLHDVRRSVATGLQRLGVRLEVTEAVLGHVSGSRAGIVGVYTRHTYGPEKRAALAAWGREVERIIGRGEAASGRPGGRP